MYNIIYGGSFSPIHNGHILIIRTLQRHFSDSNIIVLPTYQNPLKKLSDISSEDRLKSVRDSFMGWSKVKVSDFEISKNEKCYTIDTLKHYEGIGLDNLMLAMGADSLLSITSWKDHDEVLSRAGLIVFGRVGVKNNDIFNMLSSLNVRHPFIFIPFDNELSSSDIRSGKIMYGDAIPYPAIQVLEGYFDE